LHTTALFVPFSPDATVFFNRNAICKIITDNFKPTTIMKNQLQMFAIVCALLLLGNRSTAQVEFSGGLLGGVSFGAVELDDLGSAFDGAAEGDNIYGFEAGLYAKLLINPFYVRPALLYNYRNGQITYREQTSGSRTTTFSQHKLEVPVLLGLHIVGPLNIEAGPVYNYVLSVTDRYNTTDVDLGRNGLGYRVGVVGEFGGLLLGLSYQGAAYTSGSNNATLHEPYKIILGVGIRLGGADSE
jgi:hypothetical protein